MKERIIKEIRKHRERGACILALTGYDVLASTEVQEEIRKAFLAVS